LWSDGRGLHVGYAVLEPPPYVEPRPGINLQRIPTCVTLCIKICGCLNGKYPGNDYGEIQTPRRQSTICGCSIFPK
jgi:hypothetical protein